VAHWRDDLVAFVIGCSFSSHRAALQRADVSHQCAVRAGRPVRRSTVVSMRPFNPADAIRAIQIATRFPAVHGAPVHFGDPAQIGISDIAKPDYGDAVTIRPDEVMRSRMSFWWERCGYRTMMARQS
jgi:uncharacterized protein YcsI (UPF0317 family)